MKMYGALVVVLISVVSNLFGCGQDFFKPEDSRDGFAPVPHRLAPGLFPSEGGSNRTLTQSQNAAYIPQESTTDFAGQKDEEKEILKFSFPDEGVYEKNSEMALHDKQLKEAIIKAAVAELKKKHPKDSQ